jgi:hypothetical protein
MTKPKKRAVHKLPAKADVTMTREEVADAAAELHGFRIQEAWSKLRALKESLQSQVPLPTVKLAVVRDLSHKADVGLEPEAQWSLGEQRWGLAVADAVAALGKFNAAWGAAVDVRVGELGISGNHSTASLRSRLTAHAELLKGLKSQGRALEESLRGLRVELEPEGTKLARWQALLRLAGFSWDDIAALFPGGREPTPGAARKRVDRLMDDEAESERVRHWFAYLTDSPEEE